MLISTILLNWNRSVLLEQTLRSYAATVTGPSELFVIDNASSDDSRAIIGEARKYLDFEMLFLDENVGGDAYNLFFDRMSGELVHLSENDYVYLEGWAEHVRDSFRCFPDLGQLSLSSGIRRDNQPGGVIPADLRFARGKILYQAHGNVVTTSVLRSLLFQKHEIRVRNCPWCQPGQVLLPDDAKLSTDVKNAGYWCALSDRNYTRNLGHEIEEFDRDPDYYVKNYSSKPWLGVDGWRKRNAELSTRLIPKRHSTVFPDAALQPERTIRDVAGKSAQLWSMFDARTTESEVLDFLYALVHMAKPRSVIETPTWLGHAAIAIGAALRDNGFGQVTSIDVNAEAAAIARQNIEAAGLTTFVSLRLGSVLDFEADCRFDFAFFDSSVPSEFDRFHPYLEVGSALLFQNISSAQGGGADAIQALADAGILHGISFDTPRGLFVGKLLKSRTVSAR
jgi:predicted O-methyltransferase YrrM